MFSRLTTAAAVAASVALLWAPAQTAEASSVPSFDHVFQIVMENHSFSDVIGSSSAPYINSLLPQAALGTNYYGVTHPSLPNYLALTAGSTYNITTDCTACYLAAPNIGDVVESTGKTWKAYEESMPSPCFAGDSYPYAQKHDPFIYFNDVRQNSARCQSHVVPYTQLATDLGSASATPNYAFITPNLCDDMHDCSVGTGDSWLSQNVPAILRSPAFTTQHSLLAITWDEDDSSSANQVPLLLIGSGVAAGHRVGTTYNHYSLLRTIELALGTSWLTTNDEYTAPISDAFAVLTPPANLGGSATSGAASSSWSPARTDVFVRGQDNAVWQKTWTGSSWSGWTSLGGFVTSDPAAVSWGAGRIDVFARGQDEALWHKWWTTGAGWSAWYSVGGMLSSGAAATSWAPGRLDVFAAGQDKTVWHLAWEGTAWTGWQPVGGVVTSDPAAVSWGAGRIDVFARGQDGALWHLSGGGSSWSGWQSLGGALSSGAAASSCGEGRLDVFALDTGSNLVHLGWDGAAWTGWTSLGTQWTADPSAVCSPGSVVVQLFDRAADNSIVASTALGS